MLYNFKPQIPKRINFSKLWDISSFMDYGHMLVYPASPPYNTIFSSLIVPVRLKTPFLVSHRNKVIDIENLRCDRLCRQDLCVVFSKLFFFKTTSNVGFLIYHYRGQKYSWKLNC